jgi:predicted ATPase
VFDLIRGHGRNGRALLCAFDLIEVNGEDLRRVPIEERKRRLTGLLRLPHEGIAVTSGITAWRSIGSKLFIPNYFSYLAMAHAEIGEFNDAWRCIGEALTAVETTKEGLWEAEVHRTAGEIALMSAEPDAAKAQACFERALAAARQQEAKSWELRASMSLARLWRDQGKPQQARELLPPVYGWFTEGFDTRDLKDAKTLLDQLAP